MILKFETCTIHNFGKEIQKLKTVINEIRTIFKQIKEEWNLRLSDGEDFLTETKTELEWQKEADGCTPSAGNENLQIVRYPLSESKVSLPREYCFPSNCKIQHVKY